MAAILIFVIIVFVALVAGIAAGRGDGDGKGSTGNAILVTGGIIIAFAILMLWGSGGFNFIMPRGGV